MGDLFFQYRIKICQNIVTYVVVTIVGIRFKHGFSRDSQDIRCTGLSLLGHDGSRNTFCTFYSTVYKHLLLHIVQESKLLALLPYLRINYQQLNLLPALLCRLALIHGLHCWCSMECFHQYPLFPIERTTSPRNPHYCLAMNSKRDRKGKPGHYRRENQNRFCDNSSRVGCRPALFILCETAAR